MERGWVNQGELIFLGGGLGLHFDLFLTCFALAHIDP